MENRGRPNLTSGRSVSMRWPKHTVHPGHPLHPEPWNAPHATGEGENAALHHEGGSTAAMRMSKIDMMKGEITRNRIVSGRGDTVVVQGTSTMRVEDTGAVAPAWIFPGKDTRVHDAAVQGPRHEDASIHPNHENSRELMSDLLPLLNLQKKERSFELEPERFHMTVQ